MSELPKGWDFQTFRDIFGRLQYGLTAKATPYSEGTRFLRITDIDGGAVDWTCVPSCDDVDEDLNRYRLKDGDFVFARSGSIEKAARIQNPPDAVFASYLIRGVPKDTSISDWLVWFIQSPQYLDQVKSAAAGIGLSNVNAQKLAAILVPIPPLAEQCRIVAKLDSLFAHSKAARAELSHIPRLVERTKQAVLADAFKEAAQAADHYATIGDLAIQVRNGVPRRPENHPPGIPILKISAIRSMMVRMDEKRYYVLEQGEDVSSYALQSGDLLFTRYNGNPELVANCGMIREIEGMLIYPDKLIRVRLNQDVVEPRFVEALTAAEQSREALAPYVKSAAGQHGIAGSDLKRLSLPLPSIPKQREIIRRIEAAFARIDRMAAEVARATALLDRLEQATLAKAFRGELLGAEMPEVVAEDAARE